MILGIRELKIMYEKIYKDFSDWLRFTEAKILATLTIQIGFLYFIVKVEELSYKNMVIFLGTIASILLIYSISPKINDKSKNVLYYGAWSNKEVDTKEIKITDSDYWHQCNDLSVIIKKKMFLLRLSTLIFISEIGVIVSPIVLEILDALK